jgi:hypothetical protein
MGIGRVAMQFYDFVVGNAGILVQAVNVLRDDRGCFPAADEFRHSPVTSIGCGLSQNRLHFKAPAPRLPPRFV